MSMSIGGASVVVVEHRHGGMICDAFKGKLEAVLQMIDRGDLGGGLGYGGDAHKAALARVEQQLVETRRCIAEQEANEAKCSKCNATGELADDYCDCEAGQAQRELDAQHDPDGVIPSAEVKP